MILSTDTRHELWVPFFKLFNIYWEDCPYEVVLATESKKFPGVTSYALFSEEVKGCRRLIENLKKIQTEYVILFTDDYFFNKKVNQNKIDKFIDWMEKDGNIACINFTHSPKISHRISIKYKGLEKYGKYDQYKISINAGLWRTQKLQSYLSEYETPWEAETYGNIRTFFSEDDFYTIAFRNTILFVDEIFDKYYNIHKGKWCIDYIKPLFEKNDIHVDYSIRGIINGKDVIRKITFEEKIWIITRWLLERLIGGEND